MSQTKFQDLTFTCIMVLIFVYVMTFYNAGLESGVTFATFGYALTHMWVEVIGAFIAQRYIASPIVKRLVRRVFTPGEDKPVFIILATAGFTVSMMAPMMTLYVSIYHMGLCPELLGHWQSPPINEEVLQEVINFLESGILHNLNLSQNAISIITDGTYNEIQKLWNLIQNSKRERGGI